MSSELISSLDMDSEDSSSELISSLLISELNSSDEIKSLVDSEEIGDEDSEEMTSLVELEIGDEFSKLEDVLPLEHDTVNNKVKAKIAHVFPFNTIYFTPFKTLLSF